MGSRAPLIASLTLVVAMAAVSLLAWPLLPAHGIAVHFNIAGRPDGFASRWFALGILPLMALSVTIAFQLAPKLGGRAGNRLLPQSQGWIAVWLGVVLVLAVTHVLIVLYARGVLIDMAGNVTFIVALLLMVTGNFLGKIAPNDYAGVRTPWTRASDYSWKKTNRLGGWMLVGVGFATLAILGLANARAALYVLLCGAIGSAIVLLPVSRYYWKHDPDRQS